MSLEAESDSEKGDASAKRSVMARERLTASESIAEMFSVSETNLAVPLSTVSPMNEARLSEIPLEPLKSLDTESELEERSSGEILASTGRRATVAEIETAGFSEIEATWPANLSTLSVMDDASVWE